MKRLIVLFLLVSIASSACAFATKKDLEVLKQDLQQTIKDESGRVVVRSQAEPASLADKISLLPRWTWFGLEFILVGGIFLSNARRLNREDDGLEDFISQELWALSFMRRGLDKIISRREDDPPPDPDPEPPDEGPTLKVVK